MKKASFPKARAIRSSAQAGVVLGHERFERISAVEGIAFTADLRAIRDQFDRQGLSAAERRTAIIKRFAPSR